MQVRLDQVQLVSFSPAIVLIDKLRTANAINDGLSGIFNGEPVILPFPDDAPDEFPRIQLKSKDEKYNLSIAKNRVDFIFKYKENDEKTIFPVPGLFEKYLIIFNYLKENMRATITRAAIVTNWIVELSKHSAAEHIKLKYIAGDTPITAPYELELRYLIKETIAGIDVNKWIHIKSTRKISEPEQNRFVVVYIDINTMAEKKYEFTKESLQKLLELTGNNVNAIITEHLKKMEE